jgi:hypothetical protein
MVGPQYDLVGNPLGAVRATFERTAAAAAAESGGADPVAAFRGKDWGAGDLFRSFLFEQDGLAKVKDQSLSFLLLIFLFFPGYFTLICLWIWLSGVVIQAID